MNQETKVGLFVMAGIGVMVTIIMLLGDVSFKRKNEYYVIFNNVGGLPNKAAVKVAGVEVGRVKGIVLKNGKAKVSIGIDKRVRIYQDAKAKVLSTGVIGSKYMELEQGTPELGRLKEGSTILGTDPVGLEQMLAKAMQGLQDLLGTFKGKPGEEGKFGENLGQTVQNLRDITDSLRRITTHREEDIDVALGNLRSISDKLDSILDSGQRMVDKIERGEGAVGALVSDKQVEREVKQTVTQLRQASESAKEVLGRFVDIKAFWDYRQRYDFEADQAHADVGLRIFPRPGKYYYLAGNNLGDKAESKPDEFEKKNTITAEIGKDFGPFTLHGGLIRSKGGLGVGFRPLYKHPSPVLNQTQLTAEVYDAGRDRVDTDGRAVEGAVVNVGGKVGVLKWLTVGGQVEDLNERKNFNGYFNILFEDKDIAYLLGFTSLAR